ncbi:hypothetical protein ACLB2K_028471 [Fragaria x ananassa]
MPPWRFQNRSARFRRASKPPFSGSEIPSGSAKRGVKHVNGDMLETIPYTQAIMLKLILHTWDDDHCKKILRNCSNALPNNGKVIVVEYCVLPEVIENTPETKNMLLPADIAMTTLFNGKERTISEYDALAKSVGFVETKAFPICLGTCVIEFLK